MQAPSEARPQRGDTAARRAPGWPLEPSGNGRPRQMAVRDRTRLTVLPAFVQSEQMLGTMVRPAGKPDRNAKKEGIR